MDEIIYPECERSFEGTFSLNYHRKLEHRVVPVVNVSNTPQKADSIGKIRMAVATGIISTILTIIFGLTGLLDAENLWVVDAFAVLGLTIGVQMKNQACAVLLLLLWIVEKLVQWAENPEALAGLPVAILFGYFFYQGIIGTFALHNISSGSNQGVK